MTEDNGHTRPDFEEHLREVVRRRQSRQAGDDELAEDRLSLSGGKVGAPAGGFPSKRRAAGGRGGDQRLIWVAMGVGGTALAVTLVLGALMYRQSGHLDRLSEAVGLLEEQVEVNDPQQIGAGLQADIAQLNARLNAVSERLARLEPGEAAGAPANDELEERLHRLEETVGRLQAQLTSLESRPARGAAKAKPVAAKPAAKAKGWYVVLASLASREAAEKLRQRYRRQGIEADVQPVKVKGVRRYRLRAGPFASAGEARRQAERIKRKLGLDSVWVSR